MIMHNDVVDMLAPNCSTVSGRLFQIGYVFPRILNEVSFISDADYFCISFSDHFLIEKRSSDTYKDIYFTQGSINHIRKDEEFWTTHRHGTDPSAFLAIKVTDREALVNLLGESGIDCPHIQFSNIEITHLIMKMRKLLFAYLHIKHSKKMQIESIYLNKIDDLCVLFFENIRKLLATKSDHFTPKSSTLFRLIKINKAISNKKSCSTFNRNELCQQLKMSSSTLKNVFKDIGFNAKNIHHELRLSYISDLIRQNMTTKDIAEKSGFNDISYLHNYIKTLTGLSFSEFRLVALL